MSSFERFGRRSLALLVPLALLVLGPRPATGAGAQDARDEALRGRVVDSGSGGPLAGAEVAVRSGSATGPLVARVVTDASGVYRVEALAAGRYHLSVERVGYRPRTLEVSVGARRARVSVALDLEPIALEPFAVDVPGRVTAMTDPAGREVEVGRITAARIRQERTLTTDARLVTMADVEEAATLGEPDLFRALQRLPGVSTRDDYTAELWTRGADWGETRVYLDGVPLFNPVHGFGVLSGVATRSVESILFQPGVRGPSLPEGSAAVVELASRSGRTAPGPEGGIDLSLASAQAWAAAPVAEGGGIVVSLRRSWVDAVAAALASSEDERVPYAFWDLHATADLPVAGDQRASVGLLVERDAIRGEIPDFLHRTTAAWGNVLATAALEGPLGRGLRHRHRIGATLYDADVRRIEPQVDSGLSAPDAEPAEHAVRYATVRGEVGPSADPDRWSVGWDLIRQSARYRGPESWPYSEQPPELPEVTDEAALVRASLWGRRRWRLADELTVDVGMRASTGGATSTGRLDLSPHLLVRVRPREAWTLVAGVGRTTMYTQSPAAVGPQLEDVLQTGRRWILADEDRAPVRATIATVGTEAWLGERWLASVTAYERRSDGVLLPDPTPGLLVQRPPLVAGEVTARGIDFSLRRLVGRVTGSFAYSLGRADARVLGLEVSAPTDRRHVVDATAATRLGRAIRLALAYTWASGAPYTRVLACLDEGCRGVELDDPFGRRTPTYASLDLVVDVEHRFDGWTLGWFVQGRNLLFHDNAVTYRSTEIFCPSGMIEPDLCLDGSAPAPRDRFAPGIPTLPLIGLRVTF